MFDSVPMTRNCDGECGSFSICNRFVSSVVLEHQTYIRIYNIYKYKKFTFSITSATHLCEGDKEKLRMR